MADSKPSTISDDEIRDIALRSGFTLRDQPDGGKDLNPYVYEFARTLIKRATGHLIPSEESARSILVVRVDRRTGATLGYDIDRTVTEVVDRWLNELSLSNGTSLYEEIAELPYMAAKVLTNNLDTQNSYLVVKGNDIQQMGAAINALIDKRWARAEHPDSVLLSKEDMESLAAEAEERGTVPIAE